MSESPSAITANTANVEARVLGSVLLSPHVWNEVRSLGEHAFSVTAHQRIFARMRDLAESHRPIDEATLAEELLRHNELDFVGGRAYLTSLTDGLPRRDNIDHYLRAIQEHRVRRTGAKTGEELQRMANDGSVGTSAMAEAAIRFAGELVDEGQVLPPRLSEEALALRFSRQYEGELRFVAGWGRWMCWDGARWRQDDTLAVFDRCRAICRRASAECGDAQERAAIKIAAAQTVAATERLARSDRRHAALVEQWDADPWLLNTPTGTVDLHTGELHRHEREQYHTKVTAAGPGGDCPLWRLFLDRITDGSSELQAFLQRVIGYCLTGSVREHALFFLYGTGANGKSVFLSTIAGLLGDYAKTAPASAFTANSTEQHPTDLAGLRGARFVTAIENEDGRWWAEAKIKSLTGGDPITARFMRQDFFEYVPGFKLVVAGNHKPGLRNVDEAIRRRLHLIPFTVTIGEQERDPDLADKLKTEYRGILQWAIDGCLMWQQDGLNPPENVRSATSDYLAAEDAIGRWMEDRCLHGEGYWTAGECLFADWQQWCDQTGERPGTQKRFTQGLQARGISPERRGGAGTRGFGGIALREDVLTHPTRSPVIPVTRARERRIQEEPSDVSAKARVLKTSSRKGR
jgi:putative DNA primase/helicase